MHGLINRAMERFLRDRFGAKTWRDLALHAQLPFERFEPLMIYDPELTEAVIASAVSVLNRPREVLLEDLGTYLVSHRSGERLRRLLRFGGIGFRDFLHSLEELPARARLALPDLVLPELQLVDLGHGEFTLSVCVPFEGAGFVLIGLLRAMADDYGTLAVLDIAEQGASGEVIHIRLLDEGHAEGRRFELAEGLA